MAGHTADLTAKDVLGAWGGCQGGGASVFGHCLWRCRSGPKCWWCLLVPWGCEAGTAVGCPRGTEVLRGRLGSVLITLGLLFRLKTPKASMRRGTGNHEPSPRFVSAHLFLAGAAGGVRQVKESEMFRRHTAAFSVHLFPLPWSKEGTSRPVLKPKVRGWQLLSPRAWLQHPCP